MTDKKDRREEKRLLSEYYLLLFGCGGPNALIIFLVEFRGAFYVCMCVRRRAQRKGDGLRTMGSVRKPLAGCSLVQCGVIRRVRESQSHARAQYLSFC